MAKRRARWFLLLPLFIGAPWGIFFLLERAWEVERAGEFDQFLLPTLSLALIVLSLGLAGLLIRNLVKLIVERRKGILGATLRMKLVFFYLALVLLPAIVLFTGSAKVIKETVEAILRTPLEYLTRGENVVDEWTAYFRDQSLRRAIGLAEELRAENPTGSAAPAEIAMLLQRRRSMEGLQMVQVVVEGRGVVAAAEGVLQPELRGSLLAALEEQVAQVLEEGVESAEIAKMGQGLIAHAAVLLTPVSPEQPGPARRQIVAVALEVPTGIAANVAGIHEAAQSYRQFRYHRRDLVRFYVTLIGLVFIATVFVATWIGLYVARRITEPIQEMAQASREISAGNLDVRIRTRAGDEMGMLVDSFNEMASELRDNRELITRSTADLRRSNRELDERRRFIETLVANLSTAVISLDPLGRVMTANPAAEKILGVSLVVGVDAGQAFEEKELEILADVLEKVAGSVTRSFRRELELPGSAPTQQVSVQVTPLESRTGERLGSLLMVEDLTDLVRAQRLLAWQEVARRIAHEFKNPLTPIQLAAQRLRKKFVEKADDLDQVLIESTASIEHEVSGLKLLLDEFSRFARMPRVSPKPVLFREVVESVLALYSGLSQIRWDVDVDPELGSVKVDAQQMRRALINLIDNAVGAVGGSGEIAISAGVDRESGRLHIEISDSGPGIQPEDRDKMFVPYFSTKKRGTGLGLTIVHKVVTDHGGTIRVEDNEPSGARFVIELPG
jgi:two-component system nitrogen regulation sensor histidine kinase NtrY